MHAYLGSYMQKETSEHIRQHEVTQSANTLLQLLANLSQCSLHTVAGHYHPVPLVCTPGLKQLSGQPTLHHTRAGQDNTGTNVFKVVDIIIKQKSKKVTFLLN